MTYQQKLQLAEATQWTGGVGGASAVITWVEGHGGTAVLVDDDDDRILISSGEGTTTLRPTQWVVFASGGFGAWDDTLFNELWELPSDGGLLLPEVTTPVRALNTPFTPHATRPVLGLYSVRVAGVTTLASGDEGRIELRADAGAPVTARAQAGLRIAQTLGVTVGTQVVTDSELSFLFPPGWQGELRSVVTLAAPVLSIVRQTEIVL